MRRIFSRNICMYLLCVFIIYIVITDLCFLPAFFRCFFIVYVRVGREINQAFRARSIFCPSLLLCYLSLINVTDLYCNQIGTPTLEWVVCVCELVVNDWWCSKILLLNVAFWECTKHCCTNCRFVCTKREFSVV